MLFCYRQASFPCSLFPRPTKFTRNKSMPIWLLPRTKSKESWPSKYIICITLPFFNLHPWPFLLRSFSILLLILLLIILLPLILLPPPSSSSSSSSSFFSFHLHLPLSPSSSSFLLLLPLILLLDSFKSHDGAL